MIRDRIFCGILDDCLRELLKESDLTLKKCMNYCKAAEAANSQLKDIFNHGAEAVHQISKYEKAKLPSKQNRKNHKDMKNSKYCGKMHELKMEKCLAYGKICDKCSKRNHFSSVCQQKTQPNRRPPSHNNMQRNKPKMHELQTCRPSLKMNFASYLSPIKLFL